MTVWHDTDDAPRSPRRPAPADSIALTIGTWPIQAGQSAWVNWQTAGSDGTHRSGTSSARWQRNGGVNSYWTASLGPFADGDCVSYIVHGSSDEGTVQTPTFSFRIRPLYLAWLWHQHQPLYRDPTAPANSYRYPWVRLHALRDYYSMAALAAEYAVHVTFNFTPVLLRQIDDYLEAGATDRALELTRIPSEELSTAEIDEVLSTFFDADWHHQIYVHPRYQELFDRRTRGDPFSCQDLRDLQMWFSLAWFGQEFRDADVALVTGDVVRVSRFVRQQRGYSHADILAMVDDQYKILRAIVPIHRQLQEAGRIEVSTTPAFHPILPLLIDTDQACIDRPGTSRPARYAYPEDAAAQVALARTDYTSRFDRSPAGMWPAEGAVSAEAVRIIGQAGVSWIATDAGVLARSGRWGYDVSAPDVLCQPYRLSDEPSPMTVFFRDTDLSDGIGFRYGPYDDAAAAVTDFLHAVESRILDRLGADADRLLVIILDGENAWGGYRDDGRPFLRALYHRLASDQRLKTVTFSEYLAGNPSRGIAAHPSGTLPRVHDLATGSWIDEPGSSSGVDLGTWIGEAEENLAWNLLGEARAAFGRNESHHEIARAREALFAAEGSDWFWWFGDDQDSRNDAAFDELFRGHLRGLYDALQLQAPASLDESIVDHPLVWTFTRPIPTIRRRDHVSIRTNCPGHLTYRIDDGEEQSVPLAAVGGVMAGSRRFQVTLGPFLPSAVRLAFQFHCQHAGCRHDWPSCRSAAQEIRLDDDPTSPGQRSAIRA